MNGRRWFGRTCLTCCFHGNSWSRDWDCPDCYGTGYIPKASA